MVVDLLYDEAAGERLPRQCAPPGALHGSRGGRQLLLEGVEAAEVAFERRGELALRRAAAIRRQVHPKQRVQHVPGDIERQVLFELADVVEAPFLPRVVELV